MCANDPTNYDRLMPSRELLRQFNRRREPMTKYISGAQSADVDQENEAAFEAAGWIKVEDEKPKAERPEKSPEKVD